MGLAWVLVTHTGNKVPVGMFKDSGMTQPATQAGDAVVRWVDVVTTSGIIFSGTGTLEFVNGTPVMRSPNFTCPSRAWFPSKRGEFYSGNSRGLFGTASGYLADTVFVGGSGNTFGWYGFFDAVDPVSQYYGVYDGAFSYVSVGDFGWITKAVVRNSDTQWSFYRNGSLELNGTATNVQADANPFGFNTPADVVSLGYNITGSFSASIDSKILSLLPSNPLWTTFVVCAGNSLTAGISTSAGGNYPYQLNALLNIPSTGVRNDGVPSATTPQMESYAQLNIDGKWPTSASKKIVIAWEITNDLFFGATATQAYNNIVSYCNNRRALGDLVVVATCLPRSGAGTPITFETDRQTVNGLIQSAWATFADALSDVGNDATIGQPGDTTNTTYYLSDQTHLTAAGYSIVATYMQTAVQSL